MSSERAKWLEDHCVLCGSKFKEDEDVEPYDHDEEDACICRDCHDNYRLSIDPELSPEISDYTRTFIECIECHQLRDVNDINYCIRCNNPVCESNYCVPIRCIGGPICRSCRQTQVERLMDQINEQ